MADEYLFANNAKSTLNAGIGTGNTTIFLNAGDGVLFPSPGASQRFAGTLIDSSGNIEIVHCTSRSTDTLTVVRAQEGTAALTFSAADKIECRLTEAALTQFAQKSGQAQATLDADTLDGKELGSAAVADTVVLRDGSGDVVGDITGNSATSDLATDSTSWGGAAKTVSTSAPTGGADDDIWLEREA